MTNPRRQFALEFREMHNESSRELVAGRDFRFNLPGLVRFFRALPSPRLLDLLRVAASIYVVDRLARRKQKMSGYRWSRSLRATIGVCEPDFWSANEILDALVGCVDFVSGDNWEFNFKRDDAAAHVTDDLFLPFVDPTDCTPLICLYSGGLDSAAGLATRIADCPERPVVPVTVWHQPLQRKMILEQQYPKLKQRFGTLLTPLIVKTAMIWSPNLKEMKEERSQRSRSFLFAAVGAAAAAMAGSSTVEVYESGVGAINLPLMAGMIGSQATRGCHPEFLRRMSRLCSLVAERDISFRLPFSDQTKGQMVKRLADLGLSQLACSTVSCVHYPLRESDHKQCGTCPACLFRRQAMFVAGIPEVLGTYKCDLFDGEARSGRISVNRLQYLSAFLMQVVQLGAIESEGKLPRQFRRFLFGTGIVRTEESLRPTTDLLLRYRSEWIRLAEEGEKRHWSWIKLLRPSDAANHGELTHAAN